MSVIRRRKNVLRNSLLVASALFTQSAFAIPETLDLAIGSEFTIEDGGTDLRQFPFLTHVNGVTLATFSQHADISVWPSTDALLRSTDGGVTWSTKIESANFYLSSIAKLSGTELFGMTYATQRIDAMRCTAYYWITDDNGLTWTPHEGIVTFPQPQPTTVNPANWGGFVFHRSMFKMADGSLQGTMYGRYAGDTRYRTIWVKSIDRGANWTVVSTVAYSPTVGTQGFCEPVAIQDANGDLLVVMRVGGPPNPLYQTRSTDGGLTWSTPTTLPGVWPSLTRSVDPDLTMMADGTLVLAYGRPTTNLLFSFDGTGNKWEYLTTPLFAASGSNYLGVREVSPGRLLAITDVPGNVGSSDRTKIIGKYIDVTRKSPAGFESDTPGTVPAGYVQIGASGQTSNNQAYAGSQSLRISDTSSAVLTNIVKVGTLAPSVTLEAGIYPVAAPQGNIISLNSGGNTDSESVFKLAITSTGAIQYYSGSMWNAMAPAGTINFNAWNKIRIKAIDVGSASVFINDTLQGLMSNWNTASGIDRVRFMSGSTSGTHDDFYLDNVSFLGGVEDDFELDPIGSIPTDYTVVGASASVSDVVSYSGDHSLRVKDTSSTILTNVVKITTASAAKNFQAYVYPVSAPSGNLISLCSGGNANGQSVFHLAISSDGSMRYYNGTAWVAIASAGTIPFNSWSKIRIAAANTTTASLYVNDVLVASIGKWNSFATMDRVRFTSGSTSGIGDEFYVDEISLW